MHSLIFQLIQLKNIFCLHLREKKFIWTVKPQGFTLYFSQILKADWDKVKLPRGSILLLHIDNLLLYSPQASSQEDYVCLLKIFTLDIKLPKKIFSLR